MWTDAAIETLRQMALEGKSASTIAAALGAPSRNAVIGKANRIGVKLTGNIQCSSPRPPRSVTERPRRPAIARTGAPSWRRTALPAVPRERKPAWVFAEAQVGEMLKIGFEEISEDRLPMADRRPDNRGVRLLRHPDREGPLLLRRTLPDGLQAAEFAGLGRPALRGPRIDGRLKPQRAASFHRDGWGRAPARAAKLSRGRDLYVFRHRRLSPHGPFRLGRVDRALLGSSIMSNASFSRPLGTAMVGGAIGMAILDLLVRKNILTVDDVQGALTTAQSSLIGSPAVQGSLDGARIIGEIKDVFARRERGQLDRAPGINGPQRQRRPRRYGRSAPDPASAEASRIRLVRWLRGLSHALIRPAARAGLSGAASASRETRAA